VIGILIFIIGEYSRRDRKPQEARGITLKSGDEALQIGKGLSSW